jgi:hypothetical protein
VDTLTLRVHRNWTDDFNDVAGRKALHRDRARLLHEEAERLGLEVIDWGQTDSETPREIVEIVIAFTSQLAAEGLAEAIKGWWKSRKVKDVEVVPPNGQTFSISFLNEEEFVLLNQYLWDSRAQKLRAKQRDSDR